MSSIITQAPMISLGVFDQVAVEARASKKIRDAAELYFGSF